MHENFFFIDENEISMHENENLAHKKGENCMPSFFHL